MAAVATRLAHGLSPGQGLWLSARQCQTATDVGATRAEGHAASCRTQTKTDVPLPEMSFTHGRRGSVPAGMDIRIVDVVVQPHHTPNPGGLKSS